MSKASSVSLKPHPAAQQSRCSSTSSTSAPSYSSRTASTSTASISTDRCDVYVSFTCGGSISASETGIEQQQHPAGGFRKPLKMMRSLQIFCTVFFVVMCIALLSNMNSIRSSISSKLQLDRMRGNPQPQLEAAVQEQILIVVALQALCLVLSIPSVVLDTVWLAFTVSPKARIARGRAGCTRYTCDMAWDIVFAVVWAAVFTLTCLTFVVYSSHQVLVEVVLALLLFGFHILTATMSALVRRYLWQSASTPRKDASGIEVGAGSFGTRSTSVSVV